MGVIKIAKKEHLDQIIKLHQAHWNDQFALPEFKNFLSSFIVVDDNDELILYGGARAIIEVIAITDMSRPIKERGDALYQLLDELRHNTLDKGFNQLHCWPNETDKSWIRRLRKGGFRDITGHGMYLDLD